MKTNKEQLITYYYGIVVASFIFIAGSFLVLAFPKVEENTVQSNQNILATNVLKIKTKKQNELEKLTNLTNTKKENSKAKVVSTEKSNEKVLPLYLEKKENIPYIELPYGSQKNSFEAMLVRKEYGEVISYYALEYGLDKDLVMAIASLNGKEGHNDYVSENGLIGIMGIPYDAWYGQTVKAYNFNLNEEETVTFDDDITTLEGNIKAGCIILQNELKKYQYNILVGLQSYEYGGYSMEQVLSYYAKTINKTYESVLNSSDINWMKYRFSIIENGDSEYIEHVLNYYNGTGIIEVKKPNQEVLKINLNKQLEKLSKIKQI